MIKVIIIMFVLSLNVEAQTLRFGKSEAKVARTRRDSILVIETYYKDKRVRIGSGFFLKDKSGLFITNHHVMTGEIKSNKAVKDTVTFDKKRGLVASSGSMKNITYVFRDFQGQEIKDVSIVNCGSKNLIDICILKANNYKPKSYLAVSPLEIGLGQDVSFMGHCRKEYELKKGKIVAVHSNFIRNKSLEWTKADLDTELVQISQKICPGDSGSPIFSSSNGELVAMASSFITQKSTGKIFNIGISVNEILEYITNLKIKGFNVPINSI